MTWLWILYFHTSTLVLIYQKTNVFFFLNWRVVPFIEWQSDSSVVMVVVKYTLALHWRVLAVKLLLLQKILHEIIWVSCDLKCNVYENEIINKGLHRVKHNTTTAACRQGKGKQMYIKNKCGPSILPDTMMCGTQPFFCPTVSVSFYYFKRWCPLNPFSFWIP